MPIKYNGVNHVGLHYFYFSTCARKIFKDQNQLDSLTEEGGRKIDNVVNFMNIYDGLLSYIGCVYSLGGSHACSTFLTLCLPGNQRGVYKLLSSLDTFCKIYDCFHTTAKCVFWILIRDAHFELKFKIRKKDSVYAKSRRKT